MNEHEKEALAEIAAAMRGDWRLERVHTFTHGHAVRVYARREGAKTYRKVGPLLFPPDGGTLADTLQMLGGLAAEESV